MAKVHEVTCTNGDRLTVNAFGDGGLVAVRTSSPKPRRPNIILTIDQVRDLANSLDAHVDAHRTVV